MENWGISFENARAFPAFPSSYIFLETIRRIKSVKIKDGAKNTSILAYPRCSIFQTSTREKPPWNIVELVLKNRLWGIYYMLEYSMKNILNKCSCLGAFSIGQYSPFQPNKWPIYLKQFDITNRCSLHIRSYYYFLVLVPLIGSR